MNLEAQQGGLLKLAGVLLATTIGISAIAYLGGSRNAAAGPDASPAAAVADSGGPRSGSARDGVCRVSGGPQLLPDLLRESSGVAASRAHGGVVWTHNDSGEPVVHAVDLEGRDLGGTVVAGAAVQDWEDVAVGACPGGGDCVYVADIGDNQAERPFVTVYRFPEPRPGSPRSAPAAAVRLRYPDGPHDAEAMFVLEGAIHLVTKGETGPAVVYRAAPGDSLLQAVRTLADAELKRSDRITGASASPDGRWVALRTLRAASVYPADALLGGEGGPAHRLDLAPLAEEQGEGISFAADGGLLLTSEAGKGGRPTLARLSCTFGGTG